MQNEEKRRILFRTKVDKMYNKIEGTASDIIAYLFGFIITLLFGIYFAYIAVSTNTVLTIIPAAAATFFLLLAVSSIKRLIDVISYEIKNKNTIEIYIEDNKLVIKTLVPSKAINKYKTILYRARKAYAYYDYFELQKNSITKTMVFDLPLRVRKVRFKIPDPQVHAVFDKYLITFLYYRTYDDIIGTIYGFGYFYVLGLGFYPGLVYNLRFNCNGEYVHDPFFAIIYAEVICSGDVVFDGYLINDSYLIAGSEFDRIINGELSSYVILEGGGEIREDNIVDELVNEYIVKKYGLISEEELNSIEEKPYSKKKAYSKQLEFADAVFKEELLISKNMYIYIVVLDSNNNIIYRNDIENIDDNEINKLSELNGKFAIEEVIGDKSKTFYIDKNKLIERLKRILELKSRGEISMENKVRIKSILILGF
jgi:hypothetical protein